ncbi:MAG: substrate-binding domain-containing protein [Deltaproteobacteria bacterium]|nr:substrate-binding domain-containing protein [Deltaproteobacteria bacterium]
MPRFVQIAIVCLLVVGSTVAPAKGQPVIMATTTSTDNTGLLDVLAPAFKKDTGIELRWVAVGTGKALKMGENCDVDVLFVHAPDAETAFLVKGFGLDRRPVMTNDFVIIGPAADPAGAKGRLAGRALKAIAQAGAVFVSRGDLSGTHQKELSLWRMADMAVPDKAPWYVQTGQGMIKTILVAEERGGYALTDRGTYIKYAAARRAGSHVLKVLVEGDPNMLNHYSVIAVNPRRCPSVNHQAAVRFADWVTSAAVQELIGSFKLLGKPLFVPAAR